MILNIEGQKNNGNFRFILPAIRLDDRLCYKICVRHLHYVLEDNNQIKNIPDGTLLSLATNLVDRSALNPCQVLMFFQYVEKTKLWQNVKYTDSTFYSLALHEIENATFDVLHLYSGKSVAVEKMFIQLEIVRDVAHGRIQ